ncbi:MAG TPA: protein translocase subunit SecF [Candidatus Micrarchaeaceae archaeon]|nr:protein translocase subunit SecF [Candidatus Micrarchaeaceae archaeon]
MLESPEELDATDAEPEEDDEEQVERPEAVVSEPVKAEPPPREPRVRKLDIVSRRNIFFLISLVIIIPGIISMARPGGGFLLGIDFAGGTEFTLHFDNNPNQTLIESAVAAENIDGTVIPAAGAGNYIIRGVPLSPAAEAQVVSDLVNKLGPVTTESVIEVGGTIAGETIARALLAVVVASIGILLLLAWRFHNVPGGWRAGFQFGGSALAALLHDVFVLTGIFSIIGTFFHLRIGEIDALFVTAVLTVVGFSVHDTIVVFDRIRENLRVSQRLSFEQVVNLSIMQTAARSIITSFTVVLVLSAILISGGDTLKGFALALMIGIVSGTYSSIFNASPLLVVWRKLQPVR